MSSSSRNLIAEDATIYSWANHYFRTYEYSVIFIIFISHRILLISFKFSFSLRVKCYQEHFQFLGVFTYRKHSVYGSSVCSLSRVGGFFYILYLCPPGCWSIMTRHCIRVCTLTGLRAGLGYAHKNMTYFLYFWYLVFGLWHSPNTESVSNVLVFICLTD